MLLFLIILKCEISTIQVIQNIPQYITVTKSTITIHEKKKRKVTIYNALKIKQTVKTIWRYTKHLYLIKETHH